VWSPPKKWTKPKVTKAERLVNEQMLAILEWAAKHPTRWHDIGKNLYRLKPAPNLQRS
jgi:hypothetical protein